jgi:predicted NBD/HSP70 family sugar kinase
MSDALTLGPAVGTGIGAGVVINGQPLRFVGGKAGDTGRIIIEPDGPPDVYGAHGETGMVGAVVEIVQTCAGAAFAGRMQHAAVETPGSFIGL